MENRNWKLLLSVISISAVFSFFQNFTPTNSDFINSTKLPFVYNSKFVNPPSSFFDKDYKSFSKYKEFDFQKRFADLTQSKCFSSVDKRNQFSSFTVDELVNLNNIWFGRNGFSNSDSCRKERLKGITDPNTLLRCDLNILMAMDETVQKISYSMPATNIARDWFFHAIKEANNMTPMAYACAIRSQNRSFATIANDPSCKTVRDRLIKLADTTVLGGNPFPDDLKDSKNNGHKALFVSGAAIAFAQIYELVSSTKGVLTSSDHNKISNWLNRQSRVILDGQSTWQSWYRRSVQENSYDSNEGSNHFSQHNLALTMIGSSTNNHCMIEYATYSSSNLTNFKSQIGRSLMAQNDRNANANDRMAKSYRVFQGEAIDRFRGQWDKGHLQQAMGYSSLVIGSLAHHAIVYNNIRSDFKLNDRDLGTNALTYRSPRPAGDVSILDSIKFYGGMLARHESSGSLTGSRLEEYKSYHCSPEMEKINKVVCDKSTSTKIKNIKNEEMFNKSFYTRFMPLVAIGAEATNDRSLEQISDAILFSCINKKEIYRATAQANWYRTAKERVWPTHPVLWRGKSVSVCL